MGKLSSIGKSALLVALLFFTATVVAETLEVTYLNNPRSLRNFANINMQCAAHYLSSASKVTDDIARKTNSTKKEAIALMINRSQYHATLTAFVEGQIHGRTSNQPLDKEKFSTQLMEKVIVLAGNYSPLPAEYLSTSKLCQLIQDNPQSYISKLDKL